MKSREIAFAKKQFNRFFREDLYGQFDHPDNIILSRGAWNDETVRLPEFFRYCVDYTLDKHWVGYSDSLGHERVFDALGDWVNIDGEGYNHRNLGLTLGNVATIAFVFMQLKSRFEGSTVLTLEPYYPSVMKSVSESFPSIETVSSLEEDEEDVFDQLVEKCKANSNIRILFLSNFLGVEGRIFSREFWRKVLEYLEERDLVLVIDEGLWFDRIEYPDNYEKERIIRVVSPSKKYGNPGMKIGHLLGPESFVRDYYERASTSYGGPASIFFLVSEFLYQFEHALATCTVDGLKRLSERYDIPYEEIIRLYHDFVETMTQNHQFYLGNRKEFERWLEENVGVIKKAYIFEGINFFVEPNYAERSYDLFLRLIRERKVAVFPSVCLGDMDDRRFRITVLERRQDMLDGLNRISDFLKM